MATTVKDKNGNAYTGRAEVLGEQFDSAYSPIKDSGGKIIGMFL